MDNIESVSANYNYSIILKNDGTVYATGSSNGIGKLGQGNNQSIITPTQVVIQE